MRIGSTSRFRQSELWHCCIHPLLINFARCTYGAGSRIRCAGNSVDRRALDTCRRPEGDHQPFQCPVNEVLNMPEVIEKLQVQGWAVTRGTPEFLHELAIGEMATWAKAAKAAKHTPEGPSI